jgi:hypothetical protein
MASCLDVAVGVAAEVVVRVAAVAVEAAVVAAAAQRPVALRASRSSLDPLKHLVSQSILLIVAQYHEQDRRRGNSNLCISGNDLKSPARRNSARRGNYCLCKLPYVSTGASYPRSAE